MREGRMLISSIQKWGLAGYRDSMMVIRLIARMPARRGYEMVATATHTPMASDLATLTRRRVMFANDQHGIF